MTDTRPSVVLAYTWGSAARECAEPNVIISLKYLLADGAVSQYYCHNLLYFNNDPILLDYKHQMLPTELYSLI